MSETEPLLEQPAVLPWVQFREDVLTARELRLKSAIAAVRRLIEAHPLVRRRPGRATRIQARLQLREDLITARFQFRRDILRSLSRLTSRP